ncbi:MAG: c-type cytochrome biogenesis protein CcmI, partial [Kordiimonadaceae bacterium]|nr:c-type cytochrome biogenesis protein CcmI [Kordiimonadaceae bacterium]
MYIVGLIILSIIAIAFVLVPYFKGKQQVRTEAPDIAVYKSQLKELDGDVERGIISKEEAKKSRIEIERRLLKAADNINNEIILETPNNFMAASLVVIILFSTGFYTVIGSPGMPDFPKDKMAEKPASAEDAEQLAKNMALIEQVKAKIIEVPDDARGWVYLSNLELSVGNFQNASEALYNAHMMEPDNFNYQLMYAESLIMASNERVTPAAMVILTKAQRLLPSHPAPKYYLALADYQAGDIEVAHGEWVKVRESLEEGSPLTQLLDFWVNKAAVDLGLASQQLPQMRAPSISAEQAEE